MLATPFWKKHQARIIALIPAAIMNLAVVAGALWWLDKEYRHKEIAAYNTLDALAGSASRQIDAAYSKSAAALIAAAEKAASSSAPAAPISLLSPWPRQPALISRDRHAHALNGGGAEGLNGGGAEGLNGGGAEGLNGGGAEDLNGSDIIQALIDAPPHTIAPGIARIETADSKPRWPMAIGFEDRRGPFIGAVGYLTLDDIQAPLESGRLKPSGVVMLVRNDGAIVAAAPWRGEMIGRKASQILNSVDIDFSRSVSAYQLHPVSIDGVRHIAVATALPKLSLHVVATAPESEFFVDWQNEAILLLLLAVAMATTSVYSAQRQWTLLADLETGNQKLQAEINRKGAILDAEIKEREEQKKLASMLRDALEHSGTMVLITNADGRIEYANPAFYQATGYNPMEVVGKTPSVLRHPESSSPCTDLWPTILAGRTWTGTFCNCRRDGSELWVSATISPVVDADGRITHFVAVEEDATKRHVYEEELQTAKKEAEAASMAKSEFLSSMSHEMRTPMNAVMGFAQLLVADDKQPLPERQKFYAETILKSGQHLLTLVNDILDLARIESGRLPLSFEPVSPDRVMKDILPMIQSLAERRRITLTDDVSGQGAPYMEADYTRIKQVLINLAGNAVKYNHSGGKVRFSIDCRESGPIRISVTDTGIGIPDKRKDEVFLPFSRLGAENSAVEGTGIGLAVSKVLIEVMGGRIGFFSNENGGATFWVELPRSNHVPKNENCGKAPDLRSGAGPAPSCSLLILYIEDNPSNVELMEEILAQDSQCRCRLTTAASGEDGLKAARLERPNLIVMDVNLPGISGIETVSIMKNDPILRSIPVLALSADVMPETIRNGMKAGFLRYLRKPLDVAEFRRILRQLDAVK